MVMVAVAYLVDVTLLNRVSVTEFVKVTGSAVLVTVMLSLGETVV